MAISLSATLQLNRCATQSSTRAFPKQSPIPILRFSSSSSHVRPSRLIASAISNSPGKQALFSFRFLYCLLSSRVNVSCCAGAEASGSVGEDTATSLDAVEVFDLNGNAIPVSDLWKDRKAVVAFARHFGCVLCRKRADYLASKKDVMDASGVALVLIGPGSVEQARTFSEQTKFKGEVYADPGHSSYDAFRFVSGVSTTFTPKAGLKIIQSYIEGYRQDWKLSSEKDTVSRGGWQQGGIIVAGPGKSNISYVHKDKEAGDDPDIEDVLKACCF